MTEASPNATGALEGIRVLDLSRVLAGPWASQILGDLGAEVIKVEHPARGDDTRAWGPPFVTRPDQGRGAERVSAYFLGCNRNKKSVAVDIARPEGAEIVRRLAGRCDVVIENFKVGGLRKYGLDYPAVRETNPGVIYCSITGFGQDGPYAPRPGYDVVAQGMGGAMSVTGQPDGAPGAGPLRSGIPTADLFTGMYATISILAALRHKERTGEGQYIDCALLDSQIAVLTYHASNWLIGGVLPRRLGNGHSLLVPYRTFKVRDGSVMVAVGNDAQFRALCQILDRPKLPDNPHFAESAGRVTNRAVLEPLLEEAIGAFSLAEIVEAMVAAGVPGGPINTVDQVFEDAQVRARGVVHELCAEDGLSVPTVGFPARLSETPASYREAPPRLGEHTLEVLGRELGLRQHEIDELLSAGVLSDGRASAG